MLFLNKEDIQLAITMKDMIDAIDSAYEIYESDKFHMPTRMHVEEGGNDLLLMPCFTQDAIGTKLVTVFPENKTVPTIHGLVILNSNQTGEVTAVMDGSFLTGLRTGAVGGSAVRHLAHDDVQNIAIIGAGVQGLYQAVAACTERNITDIYVYTRTKEKVPAFIKELRQWIDETITIHQMNSAEEAILHAEVVITATTSLDPVLPNDNSNLLKNKLFIGIGSFRPIMQELPKALYSLLDHIFIDSADALHESGDLAIPLEQNWINKDIIQQMSPHVLKHIDLHASTERSVLFKSTGMALFDVVVANLIYQKATEKGVGTKLNL